MKSHCPRIAKACGIRSFTCLLSLILLFSVSSNAQELKFDPQTSFEIKKEKEIKTYKIKFMLYKATKACTVSYNANPPEDGAFPGRDFSITDGSVTLNEDNKYTGELELIIKANNHKERLKLNIDFSYTDEKSTKISTTFTAFINPVSDGSADDEAQTEEEETKGKSLGIDFYTGGTLDFFNNIKFKNIGGEIIVNANNIIGKESRLGGFIGVSNFRNFTKDSSNRDMRTEYLQIDTGTYVAGQTQYSRVIYATKLHVSTNQWSYYVNPTYRLSPQRSNFFNVYLSMRMEALVLSSTRSYTFDTISIDTMKTALSNPQFQTGRRIPIQNLSDVQTSGYFSIGLPMFLNVKDKYKLYFDPNLGVAKYNLAYYRPSEDRRRLEQVIASQRKSFYLFRLRITEQFSGLNITLGGEIRGFLRDYAPTINAYLGIRANIAGLLSK